MSLPRKDGRSLPSTCTTEMEGAALSSAALKRDNRMLTIRKKDFIGLPDIFMAHCVKNRKYFFNKFKQSLTILSDYKSFLKERLLSFSNSSMRERERSSKLLGTTILVMA